MPRRGSDWGGEWPSDFGAGSDYTSVPEPSQPEPASGGGGGGGVEEMPTCPPGKLPEYRGGKWSCVDQAPAPQPATGSAAPTGGGGGGGGGGTTRPPGAMSYDEWFAAGSANADPNDPWTKNAESRDAYEAYLYTVAHPNQGGGMTDEGGYENTGDPTGLRARAAQNRWSEDFGRFSNATLQSWMKNIDPGCPPNDPFRSYKDGSCVQKPIDSNGSMMPDGSRNPNFGAGGGGGGGGGRGGGGGVGGGAPAAPAYTGAKTQVNYDPRKFTYGSTWGEKNLQPGSAPQPTAAQPNIPGQLPQVDPSSGAAKPTPAPGMSNCPPGQAPMPCFQPPCPCGPKGAGPVGGFVTNQTAAVPGATTGSATATSLLSQFPSLNI